MLTDVASQYENALTQEALLRHNEERPWIYIGENRLRKHERDVLKEGQLDEIPIVEVYGIIANNKPLRSRLEAGEQLTTNTHGEVLYVKLSDGRHGIAKFGESPPYGADMHEELRRGLEFQRLGLTEIFCKTKHPTTGNFGFVMACMGESLRHWGYPESARKPEWITPQTFKDLHAIFKRMAHASIPHPDIEFGITKNGRLLLFDYDYQRVDESQDALERFKEELPVLFHEEFEKLVNLV